MNASIYFLLLSNLPSLVAFTPNNHAHQVRHDTALQSRPVAVRIDEDLTFASALDLSKRPKSYSSKYSSKSSFPKAVELFPGALSNKELVAMIDSTLSEIGFDKKKTLVATSLCCDEVNRPLEMDLSNVYTNNFWMGGLAGFPFGGAVAFGAMASHIPDDGSCLMVYGPHVGVDNAGQAGTVERRGRQNGGSCCGSAVAASGYVADVLSGKIEKNSIPDDIAHTQQALVGDMLLPYAQRLDDAEDKMVELPLALYEAQTKMIDRIIQKSAGTVAGDGKIAVLGGVQINTPENYSDYFLPLSFNIFNNKGELLKKIIGEGESITALENLGEEEEEDLTILKVIKEDEKLTTGLETQTEEIVTEIMTEDVEVVKDPIVEEEIQEMDTDEDLDDNIGVIPAKLNFRLFTSDGRLIEEIIPNKE